MENESREVPPAVGTSEAGKTGIQAGAGTSKTQPRPPEERRASGETRDGTVLTAVGVETAPAGRSWRIWTLGAVAVIGLGIGGRYMVPWVITSFNTVSTDDAFVNGHVTFVAPRVQGQAVTGGHFFPEENPDETVTLIRQFLDST